MNNLFYKNLLNPNRLILIHFIFGLCFAFLPVLFIPFYYILLLLFVFWIFSNNKSAQNDTNTVAAFVYLMMFECVSRLLSLDPLIPWELGKYFLLLFVFLLIARGKIKGNFLSIFTILLILSMIIKGVSWKGFFSTPLFF